MDINQIIFIAGLSFSIYVFIINPFISKTKKARYNRYFRKAKNTRFSLVKEISKKPEYLPEDITPQEIVGILALISAREGISKAYSTGLNFANSGRVEKYNEEFFTYLFATGKRFSNIRWFKESMEMMNMGRMLSKQFDKSHWLFEFKDGIEHLTRLRVTGGRAHRNK
ncbi:MAG: hypothetical protein JEZ00_09990 [Anaerolineaceae bacterium]|nr:hypothetical protein [Anaerolineaceae bacterium]